MSKGTYLNIRLSPLIKATLRKLADRDGRSMAGFVGRIIEKHLKRAARER